MEEVQTVYRYTHTTEWIYWGYEILFSMPIWKFGWVESSDSFLFAFSLYIYRIGA